MQADGATIIREGHGTGEGRGTSPGEVHDIALKAAETDATKRALATFGKPFGLELYRKDKARILPSPAPLAAGNVQSHRCSHVSVSTRTIRPRSRGRRITTAAGTRTLMTEHLRTGSAKTEERLLPAAPPLRLQRPTCPRPNRQEPSHHRRTQAAARQGASEVRCLTAVPRLRAATVRSASPALCAAASHRSQSQR